MYDRTVIRHGYLESMIGSVEDMAGFRMTRRHNKV